MRTPLMRSVRICNNGTWSRLAHQLGRARLDPLEIPDEERPFLLLAVFLGNPEEEAWVHRDPALATVGQLERRAAILADGHRLAEQAGGGGCPERHRDRWTDQLALMLDPPAARLDLARAGLAVDALLAARLEFEVLHGVGHVDRGTVDPRLFERRIKQPTRGPDERAPGDVLLVAGLLADEHDRSVERTFAEHRLRRMLVKVAALAFARILEQSLPRGAKIAAGFDATLGVERVLQPFLDDRAIR